MVPLSVEKVKVSPGFIEDIRFDITPRLFVDPKSAPGGEPADLTHGYMLYIDLKNKRPVIMVMQMKQIMCRSVAYITDAPEELLKSSMESAGSECAEGMYPLSEELIGWLKKELNIS
jgi:hypothetical protein